MNSKRSAVTHTVLACVCLGLVSGCAGLRVERNALADHGTRLHIPMVANTTLEYGAEELLSDVLIGHFSRDGRIDVVEAAPDMVLDATITYYHLAARDYDEDQRIVGKHVQVTVAAAIYDAHSGEPLVAERDYHSSGSFFSESQPSQRRQEDVFLRLAQSMISTMIEGW